MNIFGLKLNRKVTSTHYSSLNENYKIALEISKIGLWDWDIKTNMVFYSKESKPIIGFNNRELKNTAKVWDDRVHPEDKDTYFKNFNLHLKGDLDIYEHEYRVLCKNGNYKWILDKGKVVEKDSNGKTVRIIGRHTDITGSKNDQDRLKKNSQLITNQNMRLHNFTHIVSHNLKTHIGNLKNILEFYDDATNEKEKEDLVNHLKTISGSLTTTIVDLDDIISIKSKRKINQLNERVNLFDCVNNVIESLEIECTNNDVTIYND